jgi:hypothetical protein
VPEAISHRRQRQFIPCLRTDYPINQGSLGNSEVLLKFFEKKKRHELCLL